MKKILYLIPLSIIFFGCASFQPYKEGVTLYISEPPLNTESTVFIGDSLIRQGEDTLGFAVIIPRDISDGKVKKGTYFVTGRKSTSDIDSGEKGYIYRFDSEKIQKYSRLGIVYDTWLEYNSLKNSLKLNNGCAPWGVVDIEDFKISHEARMSSESSFQMSLIYLGKNGNTLKFGYREFYNNLARPAFSNEISYDLNESNIIGYKKAKIQVISATNTSITYKILSYFDDMSLSAGY